MLEQGGAQQKMCACIRENFKYYFADFVRKGGTPPPLRTKILPRKKLEIWVVTPTMGQSGEVAQKLA